jgi:two-component system, NarL family, invasion response regulator UvrY
MPDEQTPQADSVRVLIVDDQAPFRDAARSVIDRLSGFDVVAECESGEGAVDWCAEHHADLVLMDIHMGAMDGIETTRRLVATYPRLKVVLLSSYELHDLPPGAHTSGAIAYVNKDEFGGRVVRRLWADHAEPGSLG